MDAPTFREHFPEFTDPQIYSEPVITFWQDIGVSMMNTDRWGTSLDYGLQLFVAHHLAISARDQQVSAVGGVPGAVQAPLTSKTVDKVSASYDTKAVTEEGAGFWNSTSYGMRWYRLARMMGAGGLQL